MTTSIQVPNPPIPLSSMGDDEVLAFTRSVRVKVVEQLFTGGGVSGENSDRNLLVNMLNGLDSQAINSKRIIAEKDVADTSASVIAALISQIDKKSIFTGAPGGEVTDVEFRACIPNDIPNPATVPGEMDVVTGQMDYATFMRNNGKDADALGASAVAEDTDKPEY